MVDKYVYERVGGYVSDEKKLMKFDVVVGNPPYQDDNSGTNRGEPIYPHFFDLAEKTAEIYALISPARFLFNVGATRKTWNHKMLNDSHLKVVYFNQRSSDVFPKADIKGGVVVIYRNSMLQFDKIGFFTSFDELKQLALKVVRQDKSSISDIFFGTTIYTFTPVFHADNPDAKLRKSGSWKNYINSNAFEVFPEIFTETKKSENDVSIYGLLKGKRVYRWCNRDYFKRPQNFEHYKVFIPGANGSGAIGEVLATPIIGTPIIGTPGVGHTQTFISMGDFETRYEAESLLSYLKTKFARTMLGVNKITQSNDNKSVWSRVPLQDFTPNSDIDWTQSIPEIDQQLYKKYGLDQNEINFIESKVKKMD